MRRAAKEQRRRARHEKERKALRVVHASIDVPVVDQEGFRMVGPAQAMMDFLKPLLEDDENEIEDADKEGYLNETLALGQIIWNLALDSENSSAKENVIQSLRDKGMDEAESFIDSLLGRHRRMFPDLHDPARRGDGGFYIRERLLDPPKEYVPYDESKLVLREEPYVNTPENAAMVEALHDLDECVETEKPSVLDALQVFKEKALKHFEAWLSFKGISQRDAENFSFGVDIFLNFIYNYRGTPINGVSPEDMRIFLTAFVIRKCAAPPEEVTMFPTGIRLFNLFLEEVGAVKQANPEITNAVAERRQEFLKALRAWHFPGKHG